MNKKDRVKKMIGLGIRIALTLILFVTIGYGCFQIYRRDLMRQDETLSESPIAINKGRDYGTAGLQKVAENDKFILSADMTNGNIAVKEKKSGKVWYSNPPDYESDKVVISKKKIQSQLIITCVGVDSKNRGTTKEYSSFGDSVQMGGLDHELVENGIVFSFSFPTSGVIIPVSYTLNEEGLKAEILADKVEELWSDQYVLNTVVLLPYFGAGGLEDEGYLLVPDGTGALIDYNNGRQRLDIYQAAVYGRDLALKDIYAGKVKEDIALPVFGAKCNDNAFLAVISEGEACATVLATTSRKSSSYNQVYTQMTFREYQTDAVSAPGSAWKSYNNTGLDYSEPLITGGSYAVEYLFLEKEWADYSGMSQKYREYLSHRGLLGESALAEDNYVVLDLYGAVVLKEYFLGVERSVVTAMTTYEDVCRIVEDLKFRGVEKLIINYVGALDGGLDNRLNDTLKMESVLGSKKEFQQMQQYLEQEGVLLFVENNPVYLHQNGRGYSRLGDSTEGFFATPAFLYNYTLNGVTPIRDESWTLLQHAQVEGIMASYTASALSEGVRNVSLSVIGEHLYSDFAEDNFVSNVQAQTRFGQMMDEMAQSADYLMVHGGNAYTLPYADMITDTAIGDSSYDMVNRSIPFYQMVVHGRLAHAGKAVNEMSDYQEALLKAVETGSSLKYNLLCTDVALLLDSKYNDMMSYSYENWLDTIVEQYQEMQSTVGELSGITMVSHEQLGEDVFMSVYENGWKVIVNYREEAYKYSGKVIEGRSYMVVKGDL